jgi:hypothetical protein
MPFCALTAPPCGPVLGTTTAGDGVADALICGIVALAPSRIWTCPAATDALAVAVTPNMAAIRLALAAAPAP